MTDRLVPNATIVPLESQPISGTVVDVEQIIFALERAARRLKFEADRLHDQGDYDAQFPYEDARRMHEAIALLRLEHLRR